MRKFLKEFLGFCRTKWSRARPSGTSDAELGYEHLPKIRTQTREKWDIPNSQPTEASSIERVYDNRLREKFTSPGTLFRTGVIPVYNCHGLTFAAKRTSVGEASVIRKILDDDKYVKLSDGNQVLPGDIVLYVGDDGDIEHSGLVVERPDPQLKIPRVLSKWGKGSEVVHWVANCPYDSGNLEYYRITK